MAAPPIKWKFSADNYWIDEVRSRLLIWGADNFQDYPWRGKIPFWQGLVAEVMLQRTRARQVEPVFVEFRRRYPSGRLFGLASKEELAELLAPLGLRWRVPLFVLLAKRIADSGGRLPRNESDLQRLPGVGPYASAAALNFHGNRRAAIIDSNVVRVVARLSGTEYDGETRRSAWLKNVMERLTPAVRFREFGYALLDLAQLVCTPRAPRCQTCPLLDLCAHGAENARSSQTG